MAASDESVSLTSGTHQRLRQEIIQGKIRPNERLIAVDLAERLQISRTPVREALQLLAAEGLVEPVKRGFAVREHGANEIRQIYEVRAALEGMAARLAAERATDEMLEQITQLGACDSSLATAPRHELVTVNALFHDAIVAAADNDRLRLLNTRNSEHFFNYRIADLYTDAEAVSSVEGHLSIQNALLDRDGDRAERAAQEHILEALEVTLRTLR